MTTATLIPGPPVDREGWSGDEEEEAFLVFVARQIEGSEEWGPCPLVMNWGKGMPSSCSARGSWPSGSVASSWFQKLEKKSLVKGAPAEKFIEALGACLEHDWIELVLVNPNPFHEWSEGKVEGEVIEAVELYEGLREAYRDFLDD